MGGGVVERTPFVTVQFREDQESHQSSLINVLTAWKESKATAKGCVDRVLFNGALPFFIQKKTEEEKKQIPICLSPHLVEGNGSV